MKEKTKQPGLAHALQIFGAPGDYIFIRSDRRKTVGHTGLAKKAFKEGIFEILVDAQTSFHQLADMDIVAPGDIPFISGEFEDRAVGLAETATVALGNFFVDGLG